MQKSVINCHFGIISTAILDIVFVEVIEWKGLINVQTI